VLFLLLFLPHQYYYYYYYYYYKRPSISFMFPINVYCYSLAL
jgi:hypothetical protein